MKRLGIERYAKSKWKSGLVAFAADREATGRAWTPGDQTNTVQRIKADGETAEALSILEGAPVYARARLVKEDGVPTHTLTSYYRPEDVEGTALVDPVPGPAGRGGGFAILTARGLEPDQITERSVARPRQGRQPGAQAGRVRQLELQFHLDVRASAAAGALCGSRSSRAATSSAPSRKAAATRKARL
jgi:hypothetical protein